MLLYRRLLDSLGIVDWSEQPDGHYVQGALQLALAACTDAMVPEIIGFNLGYEQLPLHLLITSCELDELGIDPTYFSLHVTVDNAAGGHAQRALRSIIAAYPGIADTSGHGDAASMFGVFGDYELQVIYDRIRGDAATDGASFVRGKAEQARPVPARPFRHRRRLAASQPGFDLSDLSISGAELDPDTIGLHRALGGEGDAKRRGNLLADCSARRCTAHQRDSRRRAWSPRRCAR